MSRKPARIPKKQSESQKELEGSGWMKKWGRRLGLILLTIVVLTAIPVGVYRWVDPPVTPLIWIRWAESGYQDTYPVRLNHWVPLNQISPHLVRAVLGAEDQKFFRHHGFDWQAIRQAALWNMKNDRKRGASTLSMQTAKNVFLWQGRTWLRKGLEAYFTMLMELFWSKERILEVYLNIIEWGDGVFGCEAAARHYFKQSAGRVSPVEAAWLAAILPNPRIWSDPGYEERARKRQNRILNAMSRIPLPESVARRVKK